MRFGRLDLNLLVALDRLLTYRSVTQASDEMHLTQSAMSSALRRLRDYFDDPLLVQVGRQMQLTPKAESLRQPLREILVRIESAITSDLDFDPQTSKREFRIVLSDYTLQVLAPRVLAEAARQQASVRFKWLAQVRDPGAVIDRGDADLIIAPDILLSAEHPSEALYGDDFVALAWAEGRYGQAPLTLERYLEARHVVTIPQVGTSSVVVTGLAKRGLRLEVDVECFSFSALAPLLVGTDRIATVHGALADQALRWLPLVLHPLPFDPPRIVEHVQWHAQLGQDPALRWLRGLLSVAASALHRERPGIDAVNARDA